MSDLTVTDSQSFDKHNRVAVAIPRGSNGASLPHGGNSGANGRQPGTTSRLGPEHHRGNGSAKVNRIARPGEPGNNGSSEVEKGESIEVDRLVPNPWNPNRMTGKCYQELCVEVRRSRHIAKPVRVRPVHGSAKLEIVDGEHNWRAAKEVGLAKVPCVIEELDDFEAMRQTYKRNQGGKHNPLLEGEMFERMKDEENLSTRKLAKEINVPEATIRSRLRYVEAWQVRRGCAHESGQNGHPRVKVRGGCASEADDRAKIGALSQEQVKAYLDLPAGFRDRWLDNGASLSLLKHPFFFRDESYTGDTLLKLINAAGLIDLVRADQLMMLSLEKVGKLALWCGEHANIDDVCDFVRPVGEFRLPIKVLDHLPCVSDAEGMSRVLLTPANWTDILRRCKEQGSDANHKLAIVIDAVPEALKDSGQDPAIAINPQQAGLIVGLKDAPEFIREADFLSIEERAKLHRANSHDPDELMHEAKEMTVEEFRRRRTQQDTEDESSEFEGRSVTAVFHVIARKLDRDKDAEAEDDVFEDEDRLKGKILAKLRHDEAIQFGDIAGRRAYDVLVQQLNSADPAVLTLLGAAWLYPHSTVSPGMRWLRAAGGGVSFESADEADDGGDIV